MLICFVLDGLDGLLARSTGQANPYGALIDQMSDQIREVLTVAAVAQNGALSPLVATLYGVLYPLSNVGLYLVNVQGKTVKPTFKSVLTFYPFLLVYLLGGPNWLEPAGWLTVLAMALTVGQCARALAELRSAR
jgi:phosphatidylglycerophosphate synthase